MLKKLFEMQNVRNLYFVKRNCDLYSSVDVGRIVTRRGVRLAEYVASKANLFL
jgi:hypothetical protein